MLPLSLQIALSHLRVRTRQTLVSVIGVAIGVGFFISISGMMNGFQDYYRTEIIESNPHITITDEYRLSPPQPLEQIETDAAVEIKRIVPRDPVRGLSNAPMMMQTLATMNGVHYAPTLRGQILLRRAGRDYAVYALGIDPVKETDASNLQKDMVNGSLQALAAVPDGVILGATLAKKMQAEMGDTLSVAARGGKTTLRVIGIFKTGLEQLDERQVYVNLTKQQSMQARARIINEIRIKLDDITQSIPMAEKLEKSFGYKAAPWEETNSRILSVFVLQNSIIYATVTAIMMVAGFGIYNIISTIVMEKARDIAIMRSMGLSENDVVRIFLVQGIVVGVIGSIVGCGLGYLMAEGIHMVPAPGATEPGQTLRVSMQPWRFVLASGISMTIATAAAWLPSRKAAKTNPLNIIRGAT
jgi:lipoprotein-releasing system permease protein